MNLEEYIVLKTEGNNLIKHVDILGIKVDGDGVYFHYSINGNPKKVNISQIESLAEEYEHQLWCDMLGRGYLLIYLDGGWLVKGPNDTYQLDEQGDTCSCPASTHKPDIKCKHLMFRDAELRYRSLQSSYRNSLGA